MANRPTLLAQLFSEVERAARYGRPLAVAFIDLDHFKAVNDTYGHEVGDSVLRGVADVFRENIRGTDFVGRYGGEEFVLVLPETTLDDAAAVAEKLRLLVLRQRVTAGPSEEIAVSVSIGIAGGQGAHVRVDQLLRDADAAMYSAKSLGRNQTYVFAEVDDDTARIPRAPISLEGRQRASEVGDYGRQAAEAALAAVLAPLPHYSGRPSSLIAAIAVRLASRSGCPSRRSSASASRRCSTTSASSPCPTRSSRSQGRSPRTSGRASSSIPALARPSSSAWRRWAMRSHHLAPSRALLGPRLPLRPAWH